MTQAEFLAKYGELRPDAEAETFFRTRCVRPRLEDGRWKTSDPAADPILDGQFTNWGYFAAGQDPTTLDLNWAALDQALQQAQAWTTRLREAGCYGAIGSEGDAPFFAFVQSKPRVGRRWDTESITGPLDEMLLQAIDEGDLLSNYESEVEFCAVDKQRCLFMTNNYLKDLRKDDATAAAAFQAVSDQMRGQLKLLCEARLYPSFVEFPVLYVGEDAHDQLVGVATSCVWT